MSIKNYVKRGIKYIVKDYKPEIVQKTPSDILKEKIVMVTGGSSGLGYYIAKKLHSEGANLIITGRNEENLKKACEEIGDNTMYYCWDVSDIKKGKDILDEIYSKYGRIDILINNAGISLSEENFDKQFSINLKGSYFLTQNYIKKLKENNATRKYNIYFI